MFDKNKQEDIIEREINIVEFYMLAQKYGFYTPYCRCGECIVCQNKDK